MAEYKESDAKYEPGTLVMFGGEREITLTNGKECHAIVTSRPGLVLNSDQSLLEGGCMVGIALSGTVPVKVVGEVKRFDKLVPSKKYKGFARRKRWLLDMFKRPIGIATESHAGCGSALIQCVTRMEF